MKKVLALVLALAMVLGCFSTVFAKEFADVAADADCHDAVAVLSDLGVCAGKSETSFDPEGIVNRAEMAAFIINALGITPTANAQTKFTDVAPSKWYSGYVAYANSLGIISGRSETIFDPEAQVSYDEAITMLINALGYTADALTGTYPAAYVSKAKTLGILKDVDALGTVKCNRGDVAIMLYNTLTSPIGHTDKDGAWAAADPKDTMMIRLVGGNYTEDRIITNADVENALIDITDQLGAYATVYTDAETNGDIVAVYELKSETKTLKTNSDAKKLGDYTIAGVKYPYKEGGAPGYYTFKNGISEGFQSGTYPFEGSKTYTVAGKFSGNYLKEVYSVSVWADPIEKQVTKDDLEDLENAKLFDKAFLTDDNDEIKTSTFVIEGAESLADIKEDDVVTIYVGGGHITKVQVGTTVTGTVTKISGDKKTVTVGGKAYDMATGTFAGAVDDEYDLFLNYAGDIFKAKEVEDAEAEVLYGIILTTGSEKAKYGETTYGVMMFTAEGKEVEFEVAKPAIETWGDLGDWNTNTSYEGYLVTYTLDDDGIINAIDGPAIKDKTAGAEGDEFTKKGSFDGYYLASNVIIFEASDATVNTTTAIVAVTDDTEFAVKAASAVAGLDKVKAVYGLDEDGQKIEWILMEAAEAKSTESSIYGVFDSYATVSSSAPKYEVTFYVDGAETVYSSKVTGTVDAVLYTLNFDTNNVFTKTTAASGTTKAVTATTASAIEANVYDVNGDASETYALDANIVVYKVKASGVTVLKTSALYDSNYAGKTVTLYDVDEDKIFDYAIINCL